MTPIFEFIASAMAADMMFALLHTLWQGLAIALILFFVLKNIPASRSEMRYRLGILSLLLILVCWLGTFSILQYKPAASDKQTPVTNTVPQVEHATVADNPKTVPEGHAGGVQLKTTTISSGAHSFRTAKDSRFSYTAWAMVSWLAGVCVMLARMFWAMAGVAKLKHDAVDIANPAILELFEQLCRKMDIKRKIRFAASKTLLHPGVIGFWRPVLLIPVSILSEISTDDLRAILAHELAHIRRFDYLVNFCQMVVEAVLFFNPAVWWVSRQIRIEREACCDAAGIAAAGQRIRYARVLFEQFAKAASPQPATALAITGFSDDNAATSEERIHRIIHPYYKPHMKISSIKLTCWLVVVSFILLGLWKTTDIAIAMAAKIMTPAERVEVMKQISEVYAVENLLFAENEKVTVRGRLVTEDSGDLPVRTGENCQEKASNWLDVDMEVSPYEERCSGWPKIEADGSYEFQTRLKRFYIIVRPRKEYAVGFYGPFEFDPNEVAEDIDLPLKRGFTSEMLFVNEQSEPVKNAQITGGYPIPPDYGSWHHTIKSVSEKDGIAVIEHTANELANFICEAPGYIKEARQKIRLNPDEPYLWQLTSTPATNVRVVSDANDLPISGAAVNLKGKEYWQIDSYYIDRPVFTTDNQGQVELKSLSQSENYLALVHAKGYQRQYVNIQGGDEAVVRLKKFKPVKGRISGNLSKLEKDEGGPYINIRNIVRTSEYSTDVSSRNKVYVKLVRDEAHFQIDKYYGHELETSIGPKTHKIDVDEDDISNLVINIPLPSSYKKKKVVFNFVDAINSEVLPLTGKFKLAYRENPDNNFVKSHEIEIVGGKAEVEIVVPNHIQWQPTPETGWFFYNEWKDVPADYDSSETIKCYPAGAIFGTINNPSEEFSRVYGDIHTAKKSPLLNKNRSQSSIVEFDDNINLSPEGSYYIAPLPLDGEYAVSVSNKNMYWLSDDIKLSEKEPICELNIVLPEKLVDIQGQLLGPGKNPISGIGFEIHADARHGGRSYSNDQWVTDRSGRFELKGLNPHRSIKYQIIFDAPEFISRPYDLTVGRKNRIILGKGLSVSGTVYDKDTNQPLSGVTVVFWPKKTEGHEYFRVRTNSNGKFVADRFKDAKYYYRLEKEGYATIYSSANQIDPSKDRDVKLYIQKRVAK